MAIQETALNKWLANAELIDDKYCISEVMTRDQFQKLINKEQCEFSEKELSILKEYSRELDFDMTTLEEVTAELDDNLVQFPFENALKLYLENVYKKNVTAIEAVEMGFDYYDIEKKNLEIFTFDIWTEKGNFSEEYNKLLVNIPMMYLNSAINIVKNYRDFGEYVKAKIEQISPSAVKAEKDEEVSVLTAISHKLVLLQRLGLLEVLMNKYYNEVKSRARLAKIVGAVIGTPNAKNLESEIGKLIKDVDNDKKRSNGQTNVPRNRVSTPSANEAVDKVMLDLGILKNE